MTNTLLVDQLTSGREFVDGLMRIAECAGEINLTPDNFCEMLKRIVGDYDKAIELADDKPA